MGQAALHHRIPQRFLPILLCLVACPSRAESPWRVFLQRGAPVLETGEFPGQRLALEHSADLRQWTETAQVTGRLHPYADWTRLDSSGFYRVRVAPLQAADDWSNQIVATSTSLFQPGLGSGLAATSFVKFTLPLHQLDRVYFQDSVKYPFHLPFARARLPGYARISVLEFNAQTLFANAQRLALGTALRAPDPRVREIGLEITGGEAFPAARVVDWLEAVRRRVILEPGWRIFYMPSTEQLAETQANLPLFAARGIEVSSLKRWATANACYSGGWALGRLVHLPATQIPAALADGRLRLDDILVTDRVPAELPVLAGYLSLEPATPNSHVALLARSLLLPFAYVNGDGLRAEIASLSGREVLLVVEENAAGCHVSVKDVTGLLTPERRREILDSKRGGPVDITPKAPRGAFVVGVDALTPADIRHVGGKAANFGFLRRELPDSTPRPALAITFDLWDAFLTRPHEGGTLRDFIASRLAKHTYPPNVAVLRADLAAIREAVEKKVDFTDEQRALVLDALRKAGLRGAKIRFRSSTNVEDSETFSGAGLYDSFSGCVEDDEDGDTRGPSHCDPAEPNERGVFRAIRRVYASFYNENAFLERLRHGVKESEVGMAILVHFSAPDATEMANGVATLDVTLTGGQRQAKARVVSQLGAESVTNPDVSIRAEEVTATFAGPSVDAAALALVTPSSLTKESAPVVTWEADYRELLRQMNAAALAYERYFPAKTSYELDFEYKRLVPGQVGLKQMRAVPRPVAVPPPKIP